MNRAHVTLRRILLYSLATAAIACGSANAPEPVADAAGPQDAHTSRQDHLTQPDTSAALDLHKSDSHSRPDGWTRETHSNDVEADYATVFPQDRVQTLTLLFEPQQWQLLWDDMTEIYGEFGEGGAPIPQEMPPEAVEACANLIEGEACSFLLEGSSKSGTCQTVWGGGVIACVAEGQQRTDPMRQACAQKAEGDFCSASMGPATIQGVCLPSGDLVCVPAEAIEACETGQEEDACSIATPMGELSGTCVLHGTTLACVISMGPPRGAAPQGRSPAREPAGPPMEFGRNPIWIPCTVTCQDHTWTQVGFRFKGNSTLMMTWSEGKLKMPFKLDFDELEDQFPEINDQRFYGFQKLSFANNSRDSSYLREKVAGDLFRQFGVLTPRRAFVRVIIDKGEGPEDLGIYTMAEVPDRPLFRSLFGKGGGNLYKPEGEPATFQSGYEIDDSSFSKESNQDSSDFSDVIALIGALHADRSDAAAWRAGLEAVWQVDNFLKWLAANTVMQDWDTYGNATHNFYIYANPEEQGRFYWIPWDHNESLKNQGGMMGPLPLDMASVTSRWPLIRLLMDDPQYNSQYWQYVQQFVQGPFALSAVQARMQAEHDLIAPYFEDPSQTSPQDAAAVDATTFANSLASLFLHVQKRHDAVAAALQP